MAVCDIEKILLCSTAFGLFKNLGVDLYYGLVAYWLLINTKGDTNGRE
jgi:hypothetical protein